MRLTIGRKHSKNFFFEVARESWSTSVTQIVHFICQSNVGSCEQILECKVSEKTRMAKKKMKMANRR